MSARSARRWSLAVFMLELLTGMLLSLGVSQAAAQEVVPAARSEARERFERGLRLIEQDNTSGALAEFARAYELVPNSVVLFNIALVQVALQRPVDAVATFDTLLAAPGALSAEELALARTRRQEQAALVGELVLEVDVADARVELDSFKVGQTPLAAPIQVAAGEHTVSVVGPGHVPERRRLLIAGKQRLVLTLTLTQRVGRLSYLTVQANVLGADVSVDGLVVGKTPLHSSLALGPGAHAIAIARAGYLDANRTLTVGEGTTGELELQLEVDAAALASDGSTLELSLSEPDSVFMIDGVPRGAYSEPVRLPPGPHTLRVERADFFPFERQLELPAGLRVRVPVVFEPTPDKRARYRDNATRWRRAGWATAAVGVALIAAGGAFVAQNRSAESAAKRKFEQSDIFTPDGACMPEPTGIKNDACITEAELRLKHLDDVRSHEKYGWISLGAGAAALVTGVVVLLKGDDPKRYEPRTQNRVYALMPSGWGGPGSAGVSLGGRF
jgi:PEGA domain